jgi:hypothetical protein
MSHEVVQVASAPEVAPLHKYFTQQVHSYLGPLRPREALFDDTEFDERLPTVGMVLMMAFTQFLILGSSEHSTLVTPRKTCKNITH